MITISLCMIVKNEEETISRVLSSAKKIADEIIIVDTGSTDKTKEIASKYTKHIYDFEWCDDFSKARNFSFSKATSDYYMWLDADDVILEEEQDKLLKLKETLDPNISVVMMPYHVAFDDNGKPTFTYYRERILRRSDNFKWQGFIHEVVPASGQILYSDIAICHKKIKQGDASRNLRIFEQKIAEGVPLSPRDMFYYARELYYHQQYQKALETFQAFLDTKEGWVENCISAHQFIAYCHDLLGDRNKAIEELIKTFILDAPRAEICCDLGKYYFELEQYNSAIYWYKAALICTRDDTSGAFVLTDCYDFIPHIQLCVCYYRLKDYAQASIYNDLAGKFKPEHSSYLHNKKLLKEHLQDAKE